MWLKNNWKILIALFLIIGLSWIESQHISEATGVAEMKRRVFHIVFLGGIYATGIWYWHQHRTGWIKYLWTLAYAGLVLLLVGVGMLQWKFQIFSEQILDQVRYLRVFFSSPLPFIIMLIIPRVEASWSHLQPNYRLKAQGAK